MKNKNISFYLLLILAVFFLAGNSSCTLKGSSSDYDILIENGKVLDGSLKPSFKADVAIKDGRIVKISKSIRGNASKIIDAKGLCVTPGFIDLHTHPGRGMYYPENRACLNYLTQGVTTLISGQCGVSTWPIFEKAKDLIKRLSEEGIGPNIALLVGHGTVRQIVMGMEKRDPAPDELEKMKALVKEAMEHGASGLSTGLAYSPGVFSKTDELVELVKVIKPYGGIYHSHIRNERAKLLEAVKEAIEISERSGVPAQISHFKVAGKSNWGLVKEACGLIEEARAKGLKITADQYPFRFGGGYIQSLIPRKTWVGEMNKDNLKTEDIYKIFDNLRDSELIDFYTKVTPYIPLSEGHQQYLKELPRKRLVSFVARMLINSRDFWGSGNARERMLFLKRIEDPKEAQKIRQEIMQVIREESDPEDVFGTSGRYKNLGSELYIVAICVEKELEGKSLKQVATMKGKSIADTVIELELMGAKFVALEFCEEDIEYIMKKDYVGTSSDGNVPFYGIGLPHIRAYASFLHKIRKYALQRKSVPLAHVIRSQTSLPAKIMNLDERGWIKEGYIADVTVLDLNNIKTNSISNPHQYCEGVKYLLINGEVVIDKGKWNGRLPGRVLKPKK